jgi:hypothetical protein
MTEPPKTRKRTNPARPQRCSKCGKELSTMEAFNYKAVREAAASLLECLQNVEHGNSDTAWHAIGMARSKAQFLIARAEKRCIGCELDRQREADK